MIAVNEVKNNSPHFTAFLTTIHREIHRISYKNSPYQLLLQIFIKNAVSGVNFCKKKAVIAVNEFKKNNSPHFTAFLRTIHREIRRISYKNSPNQLLLQINLRKAVNAVNAVEKKFHCNSYKNSQQNSPHFLPKFAAFVFQPFLKSNLNSEEILKNKVKDGAVE